MSTSFAKPETLIGTALAPLDWTRSVGLVLAFSLFMALSAQIVSDWTGSDHRADFCSAFDRSVAGSRLGAITMIVYLVEGTSGLPFFSGGSGGLAHLLGPTGGYLVAFPAAAFITGAFAEHDWDRRFPTAVAAMAIGSV